MIEAKEAHFRTDDDATTIQNAVDEAARTGENIVRVPRLNPRTGKPLWEITHAVLLPSEMTVILSGAHLRLADGVRDNIFRNRNCWSAEGNTEAGEQHDIQVVGEGHAVLDGGEPNGLCEQLCCRGNDDSYPHMHVNLLLFFHNVRRFEVSGLHIRDARWWSLCFMYCTYGRLADLHFSNYGTVENQDGIDLRIGCSHVLIENITGVTGDDTIALTALPYERRFENDLHVEGRSFDIHDITISHIHAATHGCGILRFLTADGAREYRITATDIKDTGEAISTGAVYFGASGKFWTKRPQHMGEFEDIIVRDVFTCAQSGITMAETARHVLLENLTTYGRNEIGVRCSDGFVCEDFTIRNLSYHAKEGSADCVFSLSETADLTGLRIEHVRARNARYVCRRTEIHPVDCEAVFTDAYFTPEKQKLYSAYGRYHKYFFGKENDNRPPDNRFDGTLTETRKY